MKKTKKQFIKILSMTVGSVVGLLLAGNVYAAERSRVLQCLKGYEWTYQALCFQSAGSDLNTTLMELASDKTLMNAYRFRALNVLGRLNSNEATSRSADTSSVASFLESYISENTRGSHTRRAFNALSQVSSSRAGEVAESLLAHKDAHVRVAAVRHLRSSATTRSTENNDRVSRAIAQEEEWVQKLMLAE